MRKIAFFTILVVLLVLPIWVIFKAVPLPSTLPVLVRIFNYIERGAALLAFTLLFTQIILGTFMDRISKIFGAWVFRPHILIGLKTYLLVLLHPISVLFFRFFSGQKLDPYAVFVNACLLCQNKYQYFLTIGIISFWLLTLAIIMAILRKANPWFKTNWKKFHYLNYIVFLAIGAHGFLLGTDFRVQPFYGFAILAYSIVVGIVIFIELPQIYKSFRSWIEN
jgi:predicted ferric reductase